MPAAHVLFLVAATAASATVGTLYYTGKSTKVFYKHDYRKTSQVIESNAKLERKSYLGKYLQACCQYTADTDPEASNGILYALKVLIAMCIPSAVVAALVFIPYAAAMVAITLYRLPINVYKTTRMAFWTVVLQWDLRLIVLLLLSLIHTLFPLVVFVAALVYGFFWTWLQVTVNIAEGKNPCHDMEKLKQSLKEYHQKHKDFVSQEGWGRYDHPTGIPHGWDGTSYGLEIERILLWQRDFVLACALIVFQVPLCFATSMLMSTLKYIPSCLYGWKQYLKGYCFSRESDCVSVLSVWPFHVLALALFPAIVLLSHVLLVVLSGIIRVCFQMPWEFLVARKGFRHAWAIPLEIISDHDEATGSLCGFEMFPTWKFERVTLDIEEQHMVTSCNANGSKNDAVSTYWDRFASQSMKTTAKLIEQERISLESVQAMEPSVIQSIPAVTILHVLADSVNEKGLKAGDLKWSIDGTICKQSQRPVGDGILNHLWPMVRDLKQTLQADKKTALTAENIQVLSVMLCANGAQETEISKDALEKANPAHRALNNSIRTKINRLVLAILRVRPYQDRMRGIFSHDYEDDLMIDVELASGAPRKDVETTGTTMESTVESKRISSKASSSSSAQDVDNTFNTDVSDESVGPVVAPKGEFNNETVSDDTDTNDK